MGNIDSRDKLILSAQQLIWERGVVGISLRDVREHAGVGHGSMYHHFKCKNELALEAITRSAEEILENVRKVVDADMSAYEKIELMMRRKTNIQKGCKIGNLTNDSVVMSVEELRNRVKSMFSEFRMLLQRIFSEGVERGEFAKDLNVEEAAWGFIALVEGGLVCAKAIGTNTPYKSAVNAYLNLLKQP